MKPGGEVVRRGECGGRVKIKIEGKSEGEDEVSRRIYIHRYVGGKRRDDREREVPRSK